MEENMTIFSSAILEHRARTLDPNRISVRAREELIQLAKDNGGYLKPIVVVDFARNPEAALHRYFDWDDTEAAEKWRLHQARILIRVRLTSVHSSKTDRTYSIPLFTTLRKDRGRRSYQLTTDIYEDEERRKSLLMDAKAELRTFRRKYEILTELADLWDTIDEIISVE